tara:strand:- start:398 stop:877 length:480 start_codon:yes stop_codon:yes gene_type:complete
MKLLSIFLLFFTSHTYSCTGTGEFEKRTDDYIFSKLLSKADAIVVAELVRIYDYPDDYGMSMSKNDGVVFKVTEVIKGEYPDYIDGKLQLSTYCMQRRIHPNHKQIGPANWATSYEIGEEYILITSASNTHDDYNIEHGLNLKKGLFVLAELKGKLTRK